MEPMELPALQMFPSKHDDSAAESSLTAAPNPCQSGSSKPESGEPESGAPEDLPDQTLTMEPPLVLQHVTEECLPLGNGAQLVHMKDVSTWVRQTIAWETFYKKGIS
jgi:hypothetical protein